MRTTLALPLALALALAAARAARAEEAVPQPAVERFDDNDYMRLDLTLEKALPGGKDLVLHLGRHGDAKVRQAWATVPDVVRITDALDASGLKLDGRRLRGPVKFVLVHDGSEREVLADFALEAALEGDAVTGTYTGWTAPRGEGIEYLGDGLVVTPDQVRWNHGEKTDVQGALSGRMRNAAAAAEGQTFAPAQDWPQLGGQGQDFAAAPSEATLVEDLTAVRLVWKSETTPAGRCQVTRYGEGNITRFLERGLAGGCASPILADGRVYFQYFKPTGTAYDEKFVASEVEKGRHTMREFWMRDAADVVLAIDAATGRTLWEAEIPGGRYYPAMSGRMGSTKGWYAPQLAAADGRLHLTTSADIETCLDAATGALVWARPTGMAAVRTVIDGVLMPSGGDVVGLDAATGTELWRIPKAGSPVRAPLRWTHAAKDYAIAGTNAGTIVCVEPKTGKERWRLEGAGENGNSLLVAGDVLLVNVSPAKERGKKALVPRVGAYRLSPDGAEKIWQLGEDLPYNASNRPLVTCNGRVLVRAYSKETAAAAVVNLESGAIEARLDFLAARGFVWRTGERLILQRDSTHSQTQLLMHTLTPGDLKPLGEMWTAPHSPTSGYSPIVLSHVVADGRIFIRGARGIFCYDLRK